LVGTLRRQESGTAFNRDLSNYCTDPEGETLTYQSRTKKTRKQRFPEQMDAAPDRPCLT